VKGEEDLSRDVLKSEEASICIPEIGLEITQGSMGGKFTTIEGLLRSLHEQLSMTNKFTLGDSVDKSKKGEFVEFLTKLEELADGKKNFTFIIDDPVANSFVQNLYAPDDDPEMAYELYERSWDEDEELGIHQMKTEGYEEDYIKEHQNIEKVSSTTTTTNSSDLNELE
jgi:zinc finger protein